MTLVLELTPELADRLRVNACQKPWDEYLYSLIAQLPKERPQTPSATSATETPVATAPQPTQGVDRTLELFAQWEAEAAALTPEEIAEEDAQWETFKANMNANRAMNGERLLYK